MIFQKIDNYRVVAKKNSWEAEIKISCCNKLVLRRPVYKLSLFFVSSSGKKAGKFKHGCIQCFCE
jgi:hypothetical protein